MNCLYCSKPIKSTGKFCNNSCQANYRYDSYIAKWKEGKVNGLKGKYQISNYIRKYLLIKFNNRCSRCGWSMVNPYTNVVPLEIEHLDGDYTRNLEGSSNLEETRPLILKKQNVDTSQQFARSFPKNGEPLGTYHFAT